MAKISPRPMNRQEAQVAIVHLLLREHGRKQTSELFMLNGRLYRLTIAEVPPEDIPEAARQFMEEVT